MDQPTIQRVEEFAIKVFANREKAEAWLDTGQEPETITPRQMLATGDGRASVWQALIQIDEGIFT